MAQLAQNLIGQSPAWLVTLDAISNLAAIDKPILVVGEPGTGKTSVAARLHFLSPRWEHTWQAVNCAAMDGVNLETRLFGGTSALTTSLLESADGGTLLLDNIEAMPWVVQEKLLDLIETGTFEPVGEDEKTSVDVRILSTSSVNLRLEVAAGRFSANLLSLLAYDVITLPPLRSRKRDIIPMAEKFAADMVTVLDEESFPGFSAELIEFLGDHDWPGNVRALKSVIERAVGRAWNDELGLNVPIASVNLDP
ncbi:MAG: sigma 54-interacting transcriptional regulator, partial [Robiginitomaculum sp.]|nr:sigma 54-interacting transcriptional regulator [Robiginitomaculum sp.]